MPEPPVMPPAPAPLDLAAIRARRAAIRSTPWQVAADCPWVLTVQGHRLIGANDRDDILDRPEAEFIAAAPADIAALLAEVDRLHDLVDYYQAQHLMPGWPGPQP